MVLLSGGITHGQAVSIVILCIFLFLFVVADIYLVLFLRRRNKKLAKNNDSADTANSEQTSPAEKTEGENDTEERL